MAVVAEGDAALVGRTAVPAPVLLHKGDDVVLGVGIFDERKVGVALSAPGRGGVDYVARGGRGSRFKPVCIVIHHIRTVANQDVDTVEGLIEAADEFGTIDRAAVLVVCAYAVHRVGGEYASLDRAEAEAQRHFSGKYTSGKQRQKQQRQHDSCPNSSHGHGPFQKACFDCNRL